MDREASDQPGKTELQDAGAAIIAGSPASLESAFADEMFQALATKLIKAYLVRRETGREHPFSTNEVTATEASLAASSIMDAAGLEFFEVTLWNSWGRV